MQSKGLDFIIVNFAKSLTVIPDREKAVFDTKNKHQQHQNLRILELEIDIILNFEAHISALCKKNRWSVKCSLKSNVIFEKQRKEQN